MYEHFELKRKTKRKRKRKKRVSENVKFQTRDKLERKKTNFVILKWPFKEISKQREKEGGNPFFTSSNSSCFILRRSNQKLNTQIYPSHRAN